MNKIQSKRSWQPAGVFVLAVVCIAIWVYSVIPPKIAAWQATSFEMHQPASQNVSVEAQIRALEKREPHKDFEMYVWDEKRFLYAIEDTRIIVPGVDHLEFPLPFPIHVIAGTGNTTSGPRADHLNQIARKFAERFNKEMYGYIVSW